MGYFADKYGAANRPTGELRFADQVKVMLTGNEGI
jgi:hypothetical protein